MSYSLKYYPDPGIAFDISKMLFVKLNSESVWQSSLTSIDSNINEHEYINKHASLLPQPESDLLLYVYLPSNKTATFLSTITSKLISQNFQEFTISEYISYIEQEKSFFDELISYYLGSSNFSLSELARRIRSSRTIPDKIKVLLLSFIISPHKYIISLTATIISYYNLIQSEWLVYNASELIPNSFIDSILHTYTTEQLSKIHLPSDEISFSISFSTPDFLFREFLIETPYFITSPETFSEMHANVLSVDTGAVLEISAALSDEHRLSIISHLASHKCMTLQQIADKIGLATTTTNHHLQSLVKVKIVSRSRHSRSIYYSYNPSGLQTLIYSLNHLEKGGKTT